MKKKPNYDMSSKHQKPMAAVGDANGEMKTYFLSPEELEKYRKLPVVDYQLEKKLNRSYRGGGGVA